MNLPDIILGLWVIVLIVSSIAFSRRERRHGDTRPRWWKWRL